MAALLWGGASGQQDDGDLVFTVPAGTDDGIHYEDQGVAEALTWGPADLTAAPDGSFWIADTVTARLLQFSGKGELLAKIDLRDQVVGVTDIEVLGQTLIVLDKAAEPFPRVLAIAPSGDVLWIHDIPTGLGLDAGLSGIALTESREVLVQLLGGYKDVKVADEAGRLSVGEPRVGYENAGVHVEARADGLTSATPSTGTVTIGDLSIEVKVANDLGGLRVLGFDKSGGLYVVAEELVLSKVLRVDQTVLHYGPNGEFLGVARVPLEQYTYAENGLTVGPDGSVYYLATRPDRAEVRQLEFVSKLDPILPPPSAEAEKAASSGQGSEGILACTSRSTMMSKAAGFKNNSKYLSSTNTDGTCSGRGKPRYMGGAGTYSSVPYDWNGGDRVSEYNGYMSPGTYQAGDINTASSETCSKGVDCSGFASRGVWLTNDKYGTCTIESISTALGSVSSLQSGDIMNKCNVHTAVFEAFSSPDGMIGYESTKYNSYDRVVRIYSAWSRFDGYTPRKYNNVCS